MFCMKGVVPVAVPGARSRRIIAVGDWESQAPRTLDGQGLEYCSQDGNSTPKARQINALAVAMKKSSVPLGEYSSVRVLATAMAIARPIHAGGRPCETTIQR